MIKSIALEIVNKKGKVNNLPIIKNLASLRLSIGTLECWDIGMMGLKEEE
ncbi:MAG: hypothetical protein IMF19_12440 [Proteobacteria bacterium]|nr:hypothetical protein [Pseudomonadota bacterium]